jgi:putative transcriptional regulator
MGFQLDTPNFTGHFLIAMPSQGESVFGKTLTYVCEHNEHGALGVVVNRTTELKYEKLFSQIEVDLPIASLQERDVYFGGPVQQDRGFVLHRPLGEWTSTLKVTPDIGLTTSKDILQAVARGEGPHELLLTLGYAGWSAGQLESEIAQNAWLTVEADPDIIFALPPDKRLTAAMGLLGANWASLSTFSGRA